MEIKKLDTKLFFIALFILGLVLLVTYSILDKPFHSPFNDWWQVVKYRDHVQKEYGFSIKEIQIHWPEYDGEVACFAVASVKPDGKAEKLGFTTGDIFLRQVRTHGRFPLEGEIYYFFANAKKFPGGSWAVINKTDLDKNFIEKIREIKLEGK